MNGSKLLVSFPHLLVTDVDHCCQDYTVGIERHSPNDDSKRRGGLISSVLLRFGCDLIGKYQLASCLGYC